MECGMGNWVKADWHILENLPRKTACNDTQVNAMTSAMTHSVSVSLSFLRSICRSLSRSSSASNTESYNPWWVRIWKYT